MSHILKLHFGISNYISITSIYYDNLYYIFIILKNSNKLNKFVIYLLKFLNN